MKLAVGRGGINAYRFLVTKAQLIQDFFLDDSDRFGGLKNPGTIYQHTNI